MPDDNGAKGNPIKKQTPNWRVRAAPIMRRVLDELGKPWPKDNMSLIKLFDEKKFTRRLEELYDQTYGKAAYYADLQIDTLQQDLLKVYPQIKTVDPKTRACLINYYLREFAPLIK